MRITKIQNKGKFLKAVRKKSKLHIGENKFRSQVIFPHRPTKLGGHRTTYFKLGKKMDANQEFYNQQNFQI